MLRDGLVADEDKRAHYYGVITSESERLTRLVNNVLELSNLERRQRSVNLVVGPIRPVLEEARNILAPHAAQEGFAIRLEVEPDLPEAIYDRDALLQVLFNLIDNAVKYSKNAARRDILLSAHRQASALEIAIRDQGPGVGEAHLKRVFEPFYRGEAEMTRRSRGTGIGLALVKGLVESMGGAVGADNGDDGGFVVRLTLRLASATAQPSG
jgi:signal transduction histidine kinase